MIYPHTGRADAAGDTVRSLLIKHDIQCVAVGSGTAGRETEAFLKKLGTGIPIVLVNESGASIYSASKIAREEFPTLDLTVRGLSQLEDGSRTPLRNW